MDEVRFFSYIVRLDYGFAPNPFNGVCTLATCKPQIRKNANEGDWIIGTGAKTKGMEGKLIFLMKVQEKITFQEYWEGNRFQYKIPVPNGSLKQRYGDNIYWFDHESNEWKQEDSHHSNEDGSMNYDNFERDVERGEFVLISNYFFYFGSEAPLIPERLLQEVCHSTQNYKNVSPQDGNALIKWVEENYTIGINGTPSEFGSFHRFKRKN